MRNAGGIRVEARQPAGARLCDPEPVPGVVPGDADRAVPVAGQVVDADGSGGAVVAHHSAVVPAAVPGRLGAALGEPDPPARIQGHVLPEVRDGALPAPARVADMERAARGEGIEHGLHLLVGRIPVAEVAVELRVDPDASGVGLEAGVRRVPPAERGVGIEPVERVVVGLDPAGPHAGCDHPRTKMSQVGPDLRDDVHVVPHHGVRLHGVDQLHGRNGVHQSAHLDVRSRPGRAEPRAGERQRDERAASMGHCQRRRLELRSGLQVRRRRQQSGQQEGRRRGTGTRRDVMAYPPSVRTPGSCRDPTILRSAPFRQGSKLRVRPDGGSPEPIVSSGS